MYDAPAPNRSGANAGQMPNGRQKVKQTAALLTGIGIPYGRRSVIRVVAIDVASPLSMRTVDV